MTDQQPELAAVTARGTPSGGAEHARIPLDAVGHLVRVSDAVTALVGRRGTLAVVERVAGSRVVVRRGDGMKAVLNAESVVVVQRVERGGA